MYVLHPFLVYLPRHLSIFTENSVYNGRVITEPIAIKPP